MRASAYANGLMMTVEVPYAPGVSVTFAMSKSDDDPDLIRAGAIRPPPPEFSPEQLLLGGEDWTSPQDAPRVLQKLRPHPSPTLRRKDSIFFLGF